MTAPAPRIRIVIDEVRVRGLSPRDARRMLDTLERELRRLGPQIAQALETRRDNLTQERASPAPLPAPRRIETAGAPIARAILKAIAP
jgi:hypothetical protein